MARYMYTFVLLITTLQLFVRYGVAQSAQVPCLFIFGDSLSDSGNNNHLASIAKANYLPYGIDFPLGPTGRFTNGRTTIDIIGDHLGLDSYIQPFSNKSHVEYAKGVNYASGSAGIDPQTGTQVGQRIPMDKQLEHHKQIVNKIITDAGTDKAAMHLNKCLYSVYVGSNDWMLNFFGGGTMKYKLSPNSFGDDLIIRLMQQINKLYNMGARKVIIFGLGPLGCLPPVGPMGMCSPYANAIIEKWNNKLKVMVETLNSQYGDARFIWINSIQIITKDLKGLGLPVRNSPCCNVMSLACVPLSKPCKTRNDHAYWDLAHPTEAANRVLAARAYRAQQPNDAYPMDISSLAAL
ncbi:GDSL esterase/lipase At1g29670-like [Silene latifolia]|uniref:GDSL esterase/lipase At1g29670-like n=1 Tax=Silene latifolia TaxID=37657 RepID=UPI003D77BD3C